MNEQHELAVNGTWIIIFGIAALLGFAGWLWYLKRKYPKMTLGESLSMIFAHESETVFILACILINFSEAVMAASIHPVGQAAPNPLARFLSHSVISIIAISAGITLIRDIAKIFVKGLTGFQYAVRGFRVIFVFIAAMGIPALNMFIIANGLHESVQLQLLLSIPNPFVSSKEYQDTLVKYALSPEYNAWAGLSYVMCTTVALTAVHILMVIIEGTNNVDSSNEIRYKKMFAGVEEDKEKEKGKGKDKGKNKEEEEEKLMAAEERLIEKVKDNLEYLLRRVGYGGESLAHQRDVAAKKMDAMQIQEQSKMAERLAKLVNSSKTADGIQDAKEKSTAKAKVAVEIRELFGAAPNHSDPNKRGFGISLKGKK